MKPSNRLSYLSDIRPFKVEWWIQVKVLHTWQQKSEQFGETLEIIFADKKGTKIHASCKKNYLLSLGSKCIVGEWKNIENFSVSPAGGGYRPTGHTYKMSFIKFTSIETFDYNDTEMFLDLMEFETILSGKLNTSFLIDAVGQAIDIGEKLTLQCSGGKEKKKIEFTLRDINDERLTCCLWGDFADLLESYREEAQMGVIVCLIRFAKIGSFRGKLQISNAFDTSQLLINPPIEECSALVEMFRHDTTNMSIVKASSSDNHIIQNEKRVIKMDTWDQYDEKTISEVLSATQIGKCKVVCTIDSVDTDYGWYYFGCELCNTKTFKVRQSYTPSGKELAENLFWCEKCKTNVTNVSPKFKLHLILKDDTGITKFMLLDSIANGIIVESAAKLLNGSFDEIEDPEMLPQPIRDVVGKTFKFGISIEKNNIAYGFESYKVSKVWSISNILMVDSQSETRTILESSSNEVTLPSESDDSSVLLKTPTSKRSSNEKDEVPELTSTSKRQCSKNIKIEKI